MHHGDKKVIGIGGNIGSGKTTAARIFESYGAQYLSADRVGREVLPEIAQKLKKRFGPGIMRNDRVDRIKLQRLVFAEPGKIRVLNSLSHPVLKKKILQYLDRNRSGMIVVDAALLFDWPGILRKIDYPILVTASKRRKMMRSLAKGMEQKIFLRILRAQKTESAMAKKAKFVIRNDSTLLALKRKCKRIFEELKNDC